MTLAYGRGGGGLGRVDIWLGIQALAYLLTAAPGDWGVKLVNFGVRLGVVRGFRPYV